MTINSTKLAEDILDAWQVLDVKHHVNDRPCGVPDRDDIEVILQIAFFASIEREEGDFIRFSLIFLQTHKDTKTRHRLTEMNRFLRFNEPVELAVQSVRKLASSVDDKRSSLVIEKHDAKFLIIGIAPFGPPRSRFSDFSADFPRPEAFTISVHSPGSLLFSRASSNLGRLISGNFEVAQVTPFHSGALGRDLIAQISMHASHAEFRNYYWHWYRDALEHILRSASAQGHGGSIIWIPKQHIAGARGSIHLGHTVASFPAIYQAFLNLLRTEKLSEQSVHRVFNVHQAGQSVAAHSAVGATVSPATTTQLKAQVKTMLNMLAHLTRVDGATIMDDYFEPLRFGARLSSATWSGSIRPGPTLSGASGEEISRGRFGTRHNSAIDFVAAVPGSIAFVLSQDGPVRAIARRDDVVFLWPDCLDTMFVA